MKKTKDKEDTQFWDANYVSELLKISKSHLYKMTSAKQIPHLKFSRKVLFEKPEIIKWLKSKKVQ